MSDQARVEEARRALPLPRLMEQYGDSPPEGRWKSFTCPFCRKKGASVKEFRGRHWFKCFHASCSSATSGPKGAWDEVAYLAHKTGLSRKEAFIAFLKAAGVWKEERSPSLMPGTRGRRRPLPSDAADKDLKDSSTPNPASPGADEASTEMPVPMAKAPEVYPPSSVPSDEGSVAPDGAPTLRDPQSPAGAAPSGGGDAVDDAEVEVELATEMDGQRVLQAFYGRLALADKDAAACWHKRGLTSETTKGLRSNPKSNLQLLQDLAKEYKMDALVASGLFSHRYGHEPEPNRQFYGYGIKGKKPRSSRMDPSEGDFEWDWVEPMLIPYFDDRGELFHLRPHKGMLKDKSSQLYIPFPTSESQVTFECAVITEGEFKALGLFQALRELRNQGTQRPAFGVCSIPGISSVKKSGGGWWIRDRMETWLRKSGARRVVVAYDNEEKGDPNLPSYKPNAWTRHETQAWARYLAEQLSREGYDARVCVLPKEWRDANGKADWDGALAMLLRQGGTDPVWADEKLRIQRLFVAALKEAQTTIGFKQLGLFDPEHEAIIARRVRTFSYEAKLPLAGDREKWLVRKLTGFIWECRRSPGRIGDAPLAYLEWLCRKYRVMGGGYYTITPLRSKSKAEEHEHYRENWQKRLEFARGGRDQDYTWACEIALQGVPEQFTDFYVRPYYILKKEQGELHRLVRIYNVHGEKTELLDLDKESFSAPKPLRVWLGGLANVTWGAGERELNALQFDIAAAMAHKLVVEVPRYGWHEPTGLWFFKDVAIGQTKTGEAIEIEPEQDTGIFWFNNQGYKLSDRDQEGEDFKQAGPMLHPSRTALKEWMPEAGYETEADAIQAMFRDVSTSYCDALGGYEGFLAMGMMLAYGAAPELYREFTAFPGLWLHGEQQQGKSSVARWLLRTWGFTKESGVPLEGTSTVGLRIGMQQYSNLPLWVEEYQTGINKELINAIKYAFNREAPTKKTFGEAPRRVLAGLMISGVATSSDAQVRGRYPHVHVSSTKRRQNNFDWFQKVSPKFYLIGRHLLRNRKRYVELVMEKLRAFLVEPSMDAVPQRSRYVYGVAYAAFSAMSDLLAAHPVKELVSFRKYLQVQCMSSSEQVREHVDVTQFWNDLISAWRMGAFGEGSDLRKFFRAVRGGVLPHPPGAPNQGEWEHWKLALHPSAVFEVMERHWRQVGRPPLLKRSDLVDQMSKYPYWITNRHKVRFGDGGVAWGWLINLDQHEMGYQAVTDEELEESRRVNGLPMRSDEWEDPRQGELYGLVWAASRQADAQQSL